MGFLGRPTRIRRKKRPQTTGMIRCPMSEICPISLFYSYLTLQLAHSLRIVFARLDLPPEGTRCACTCRARTARKGEPN